MPFNRSSQSQACPPAAVQPEKCTQREKPARGGVRSSTRDVTPATLASSSLSWAAVIAPIEADIPVTEEAEPEITPLSIAASSLSWASVVASTKPTTKPKASSAKEETNCDRAPLSAHPRHTPHRQPRAQPQRTSNSPQATRSQQSRQQSHAHKSESEPIASTRDRHATRSQRAPKKGSSKRGAPKMDVPKQTAPLAEIAALNVSDRSPRSEVCTTGVEEVEAVEPKERSASPELSEERGHRSELSLQTEATTEGISSATTSPASLHTGMSPDLRTAFFDAGPTPSQSSGPHQNVAPFIPDPCFQPGPATNYFCNPLYGGNFIPMRNNEWFVPMELPAHAQGPNGFNPPFNFPPNKPPPTAYSDSFAWYPPDGSWNGWYKFY